MEHTKNSIFIEGLTVRGIHGVMEHERVAAQEFKVDVRMEVDTEQAATSDALADTLDYAQVKATITDVVQNNSFQLLEKLAGTIATALLTDTKIKKVELTIRKTEIWDNGVPGVTIVCTQ